MEEMLKQILAGQQEILATLQQHSEILNQHSEILHQHSQQLGDLQKRQLKIENRLDNEIVPKINVLFDAFELRGDQIEKLQKHLDERLDVITMDVNFLMGKTARMDTALVEMRRAK